MSQTDAWCLFHGDALDAYGTWPTPAMIISDGAYGIGGFDGDPRTVDALPDWYRPHLEAWSNHVSPATTLWFWNTEVGWATVHPLLLSAGWEYVETITWDKGLGHVAGNVNSLTTRRFPVVTEVCVFYRRRLEFESPNGVLPVREWLRSEWRRAGLTIRQANDACGVANAASRKYLGNDWQWYLPPPTMVEKLADYANRHGDKDGAPYLVIDGAPVTATKWASLRDNWHHVHSLTNVWNCPTVSGPERFKLEPAAGNRGQGAAVHLNQKPLALMARIIEAATVPGDVVWEPYGGLCSASVAAVTTGRRGFAAEHDSRFAELAAQRLAVEGAVKAKTSD